jgi:hypothetical protein
MNAGVSTTPWGVLNQPRRALPASCEVRKAKSDIGIVKRKETKIAIYRSPAT